MKNGHGDSNCRPSATSIRKANPEGCTEFRKPGKKAEEPGLQSLVCGVLFSAFHQKKGKNK